MIGTFKSKELKRLWEEDDARGVNPNFVKKIRRVLAFLSVADDTESLDIPGFHLHQLSGDRRGQWSMTISRNWRITFYFEEGKALEVDFEDYHGR